jgi:dihydroorotate dehydrogenase (NAD+) catalytic subunit
MPDLRVKAGGLQLANPLLAASGCYGYGTDLGELLPPTVFGAVVTKTVTPRPRRGNPIPRMAETPAGMLNSIGLENVGLDAFMDEKLPVLVETGAQAVVSISAAGAGEFAEMARRLDDSSAAALELNLSCPNVAEHGANFAADPAAVDEITAAVKGAFTRPVWVKLSPNVTDIAESARAAAEAGADAVTAINTLLGMDIQLANGRSPFARVTAGLSGPAIRPVALAAVWRIAQEVGIPVIGVGGVARAEDALKMLAAGAEAVQVGTALFANPAAPREILAGIDAFLERDGCSSVAEWKKQIADSM